MRNSKDTTRHAGAVSEKLQEMGRAEGEMGMGANGRRRAGRREDGEREPRRRLGGGGRTGGPYLRRRRAELRRLVSPLRSVGRFRTEPR